MSELTERHNGLESIYDQLDRDPAIKSEHTRRGYRADLAEFESWRGGRRFSKLLIEEYAARLQQQGKAPSTINRKLAALRWWARRLADLAHEGDMSEQDRREVITQAERVASVSNVSGDRREQVGRHITPGEIEAVIRVCQADSSPAGARDAAIFALLRAGGLRRGELVGLDYAHVYQGEGETLDLLIAHGKGDKSRVIPINNGAYLAVADWLKVRGDEPGPLFCVIRKGGRIAPADRLTGDGLRQIQDRRTAQAGVPSITLHDWRRTFAGDLLDRGTDIVTVASLMGHSSVSTTARYDRRGDEARRRAVSGLFVPYTRREG
jgi:site-specific recombinase XerD